MVSKNCCYPLLLVLAVVGGCTHYSEKLDTNLQSWVGKHPDELIEKWGAPKNTYVMEKGAKVLSFEASEVYSRTFGYYYRRADVYTTTESCKISFFTDNTQKTIDRFSYAGSPETCYEMIRALPEKK